MASRGSERELARSRQRFETRMARVRYSIGREIGTEPEPITWAVPLLAFAGGMAAAMGVVGRFRKRRRLLHARRARDHEVDERS